MSRRAAAASRSVSLATSASALAARSRIFCTTFSGAFPTNAALPNLAEQSATSFSATARSLTALAISAATSIVDEVSTATVTVPAVARATCRVALAANDSPAGSNRVSAAP